MRLFRLSPPSFADNGKEGGLGEGGWDGAHLHMNTRPFFRRPNKYNPSYNLQSM
jgi:hypothetical protein